jgi:hypothetical protein
MSTDTIYASPATGQTLRRAVTSSYQTLAEFGVVMSYGGGLFDYFVSLDAVLTALNKSGAAEVVEAAFIHVDCLADRAGCSPAAILGGGHFATEPQVILDALANISDLLQAALRDRRLEDIAVGHAHFVSTSADNSSAMQSAPMLAWQTRSKFPVILPRQTDLVARSNLADGVATAPGSSGAIGSVKAALAQVDDFANKVGCDPAVIRNGGDSVSADADPALRDALGLAWQTLSGFNIQVRESNGLFDYFGSLHDVLTALTVSGGTAWVETIMSHVDYLADAAGCESKVILKGGQFSARQQIILDAVINIDSVLRTKRPNPLELIPEGIPGDVVAVIREAEATLAGWPSREKALVTARAVLQERQQVIVEALKNIDSLLRMARQKRLELPPEGIPDEVFALILDAEAKLEGWCSREKALVIARTVLQERPRTCVEIGIFGGRSLVPCAAALRHIGTGTIYGIEAWSPGVAIENTTSEDNDEWWSKVDFPGIKREFYRFVAATNLTPHVRLIEARSGRASALFDQIDFLHIDGSHSMVNAAEDVILYARKVRSGGIIVFDDVNWQSTAPAREILSMLCDTVTVLKNPESGEDICAVLRRR